MVRVSIVRLISSLAYRTGQSHHHWPTPLKFETRIGLFHGKVDSSFVDGRCFHALFTEGIVSSWINRPEILVAHVIEEGAVR